MLFPGAIELYPAPIKYIPVYTLCTFIQKLIKALEKANVRYALIGGYAVALHGAVRGTVEVDLIISLDQQQYEAAEKTLQKLGLQSRLPVSAQEVFLFREEYIQNRNLIAWSFVNPDNPLEVVDILITENADTISTVSKQIGRMKIKIASINDLIVMKRKAGRPQDIEDIKALEQLQ